MRKATEFTSSENLEKFYNIVLADRRVGMLCIVYVVVLWSDFKSAKNIFLMLGREEAKMWLLFAITCKV